MCQQICSQSEMVAQAASVLQLEEQKPPCCPPPSPPRSSPPSPPLSPSSWDPSQDVRCIATTFQYLQASGVAAALLQHHGVRTSLTS